MSRLAEIRAASTWSDLIEGQPQHLAIAVLMATGAFALLSDPMLGEGPSTWDSRRWAMVSIVLAIAHQVIVAFVFRMQLYRNMMTRLFGAADLQVWAAIFMPFLLARPITVFMTGLTDYAPLPGPWLAWFIPGLLLMVPAIWAMHSVLVHFTLPRALGGDHFRDLYAEMPLVRKGAFRYTDNAMYGIVFLGLWGIALMFASWNALVVAFFQHAYIWVHMYCTEKPDMERIYGAR